MPTHRIRALAALLTVLALSLGACGDDDDDAAETGAVDDAAPAAISLEARDFEFSPASVSAPAGETVTVEVENTGQAPHTFTASAVDVDEQVAPGGSAEVTFTMPDGNVEFVCRFHEGQGMTGTVEAE